MMVESSFSWAKALLTLFVAIPLAESVPSPSAQRRTNSSEPACRYLPGDPGWPSAGDWAALNATVGGRLIRGASIGEPCYGDSPDVGACAEVQKVWQQLPPFLEDPVNVISAYFEGTTCSPFYGPLSTDLATRNFTCTLGRLASYAINVSDAATAVAGVNFARENNIRLVIKNTGHDILGRSTGQGSLALWSHYLKGSGFFQYTSEDYTGPAARIGAGVQVHELYEAAAAHGFRVTGGACPTVGAAGGWIQSGGHGPLSALYGLGSDQTLEFEVVTADGRHLNASRSENADLFWALSGGGPGNFAMVLSVTLKAHPDGPVAGATLNFVESDPEKYFAAIEAWQRHLLVLDTIPGFQTSVTLTSGIFSLNYLTLPDACEEDITSALTHFLQELASLNITATMNTTVHHNFLDHYQYYEKGTVYSRNITVGNRIIPRDLVTDDERLSQLTEVYKDILAHPNTIAFIIASNVTHARVGNAPGDNPVIQAWRDSLFILNFGVVSDERASSAELSADLALANKWQIDLRDITPGGGNYMNEATYNYPYWKEDYYGEYYDQLAQIKTKYDSGHVLWAQPAAGNEAYELKDDGHLCKT
ncbi:hypothetical protein DL765_000444 [Monosporascus sp. GIB2]|nr:hypothetical protein DL765_000444 [Monosporascus sp. GIB2]